jgi:DNA-binding XRE family transcriptional regulator
MAHGWRYAFQPTDRLAQDVGVSPRTVRRLLSGETRGPSFALAEAVARALSADLRLPLPLPVREVFSPDGTYPTGSTCALCDCEGCLPEYAHDRHGNRRPEFADTRPGDWCRHPAAEGPPGVDGPLPLSLRPTSSQEAHDPHRPQRPRP